MGRILFLGVLVAVAAGVVQAQDCFTFKYNDHVRAQCGDTVKNILGVPGLSHYAVYDSAIAAITEGNRTRAAVLISGGRQRSLRDLDAVYASCGTIFGEYHRIGKEQPFYMYLWDILSDRPESFGPLREPVCDEKRSLVVGQNSAGNLVTPAGRIVVRARGNRDIQSWDISPSAEFIAYTELDSPPQKLCIARIGAEEPTCYSMGDLGGYGKNIAVNDGGEVLFVQTSAAPGRCYYSGDSEVVSRRRSPGSEESECFGIWHASPKSPPKELVPLAFNPYWISASALERLTARLGRASRP